MEVGQICKKLAGREAGRYCVIVKIEGKLAEITGIRKYRMCRRRRCNLKHLKPTKFKIEIDSEKQEGIEKKILESGIITKLGLIKDKSLKKRKIVEKPKIIEKKVEQEPQKKPEEDKRKVKSNKTK